MSAPDIEQLKYPIGKFNALPEYTEKNIKEYIADIEALPGILRNVVKGLNDKQLDTPYRPDGWTIRQVVHHIADSHMNSYIRFKWTLTEDQPTIKAYYEERWAELEDGKNGPVEISLDLIEILHKRWVILLKSLSLMILRKVLFIPLRE